MKIVHPEVAVFAVNQFGKGGHPLATIDRIDEFDLDYIADCLDLAIGSSLTSDKCKTKARLCLKSILPAGSPTR